MCILQVLEIPLIVSGTRQGTCWVIKKRIPNLTGFGLLINDPEPDPKPIGLGTLAGLPAPFRSLALLTT